MRPASSLAILAALVAGPTFAQPVAYTDAIGQTHAFDAPPQRVVAFFDYPYGQLAGLGVVPVGASASRSVGSDPRYFPDRSGMVEVWVNDGVDIEQVAALDPDLILGPEMDELSALGALAPYGVLSDLGGIEGMAADLRALGALFGVPDRAEATIDAMEGRLAAYAARVLDRPSVMLVGDPGEPGGDLVMFTASSLPCDVLDRVASCAWPDPAPDNPAIEGTVEALLAFDPDIILVANWTDLSRDDHLATLAADPLWPELTAARTDRVVSIADYADPFPAGVLGVSVFLDTVMPELFPDLFPAPLTDAEVAALSGAP